MRRYGFTLIEMLVVTAVLAILIGIAAINFRPLGAPLQNGSAQLESFLKQARVRAIATTRAYKVVPTSTTALKLQYANTCNPANPWTDDNPVKTLQLPDNVSLNGTAWGSVCFSSRGAAYNNLGNPGGVNIGLIDNKNQQRSVQIMLGGGVRQQ